MSTPDGPSATQSPGPGYDALVAGAALYADPDRSIVRVEGTRATAMLDGLLSADLGALKVGDAALSFVLTSKGRPVAVPRVVRLEESILLDVSRPALPGLLDHFGTYLPPRFASVTVLEDACRLSLIGPGASELLPRVLADLARDPLPVTVVRDAEEGAGTDFYILGGNGERESLESTALAAGATAAGPEEFEIWRIEMGLPRFGQDVTAENLPQETGLVSRAVSFDKGCYTGQEVVARIHYRGQVNRHLRGLRPAKPCSGISALPGSEIRREGRAAGVVTSWCTSPRFGPIGLGYVRREVDPGATVEVATDPPVPCVVSETPFTSM